MLNREQDPHSERKEGESIVKKNKGQSLVEFALVVPFFLLLLFAIIYCGMLFHDYSTLSSVARSAAREAAIVEKTDSTTYDNIATFYKRQTQDTLTALYKPQNVKVQHKVKDGEAYVEVRIQLARTINSFVLDVVTPLTFDIVYFMKKDTPTASTPSS